MPFKILEVMNQTYSALSFPAATQKKTCSLCVFLRSQCLSSKFCFGKKLSSVFTDFSHSPSGSQSTALIQAGMYFLSCVRNLLSLCSTAACRHPRHQGCKTHQLKALLSSNSEPENKPGNTPSSGHTSFPPGHNLLNIYVKVALSDTTNASTFTKHKGTE